MCMEGSKEVLIKTYEFDPQRLYLWKKQNKTLQNLEELYNHVKALWDKT